MAISQKANEIEAKKTQEAKTPAPKAKDADSKAQQFKATGASIRQQESAANADYAAIEGSKQDKVAFVCALGDPNRKQGRVEGGNTVPSYVVVGYKFKLLEDMTVPKAPIKTGFKSLVDVESMTEVPHKAGDIVALNLAETGAFLSKVELAGKINGEGDEVALTVKMSAEREEPLPVLKKTSAGSIKANMELIADMVGETADQKGKPQIKPEYADTFGVLYVKKSVAKGESGAAKKAGESSADIAAAFRKHYAGKFGTQA